MRTVSRPTSVDLLGAVHGIERRIDLGEIPDIRTVQNGGAELGRLNRVLPAVGCERTSHKDNRGNAVNETQFAHGIGNVDVGRGARQFAARAQPDRQMSGTGDFEDARTALGVARRNDREQPGKRAAQPPMCVDQRSLLTGMRRRCRDDGPCADR